VAKVFSINDFKAGLDVRRTPLTAPGGTLRILENAVINSGGEIEKRLAFSVMTTLPTNTLYAVGHGGAVHVFGFGLGAVVPGVTPVPIIAHNLAAPAGDTVDEILDVEPYGFAFFVCGYSRGSNTYYCWYNDALVNGAPGTGLAHGSYARTFKTKVYRTYGAGLYFSGVGDPAVNDPASTSSPGAGFIDMSLNDPEGEATVSMEVYQSQMAVFARMVTQIWALDPDPTKDELKQIIRIGTFAPHSVSQFTTGDILFLSDSGVRSLRTITITAIAGVNDIGSPIDPIWSELIRFDPQWAAQAQSTIHPMRGAYWISFKDAIYVLSYYPAAHVTAWSKFTLNYQVAEFLNVNNLMFSRGTNNVLYLYGGLSRTEYDSAKVVVRTPHLSIEGATVNKRIQSMDVMCQGAWSLSAGMLPNNTEAFELVANIQDNTYGLKSIPFAGYGTHIGLHLEHQAPGPALLAAINLNIQEGVTK
jgi:hypothetical protein